MNFISGTGFQNQRPGNQSGYINSYGNGHRSNFNQNSEYQKPHNNNFNSSNSMSYGNSSYQNMPPQTRESKIEAMIDQILKGQQKLMVNVNGKIDAVYTELNAKFETLNTHVKKLETYDITQITLRSDFTLSNKRFNCST